MEFQLRRLHLEQYFIQPKQDQNFRNLCCNYCVSTSFDIYIFWGIKKSQHSMLYNTEYKIISVDNYYQ